MQNMGKMYYTNTADVITRSGGLLSFTPGAYTIEAEGLYTGYRYYETRYATASTAWAMQPLPWVHTLLPPSGTMTTKWPMALATA